jgi:hypothetical protein
MRKRPHFSSNRNGQNNNQNGGYNGGNGGGNGGQNRGRRRPHNGGSHRQHSHGGGDGEFVNPRQVQAAKNNREKYINQARDAMSSGDRVKAEYYYQHADHYQRILNLADEQQAAQRQEHGQHRSHSDDDNSNDAGDYNSDTQGFEGERNDAHDGASYDASSQEQGDQQPRQQQRNHRRPYRQDTPRHEVSSHSDSAVVEGEAHSAVEPQEPRQERQPRAPRQPREPRPERTRQPREPQLDFDDNNHGSQLEALLPAPKDI